MGTLGLYKYSNPVIVIKNDAYTEILFPRPFCCDDLSRFCGATIRQRVSGTVPRFRSKYSG